MRPRFVFTASFLGLALAVSAQAATYFTLADSLVAGPNAQPTALARSANGQTLYLAGDRDDNAADGGLMVLRLEGGEWVLGQTLFEAGDMKFGGEVRLALSPDGRFLYATADGRVVVFTVANDGTLTVLEQHEDLYTGDPLEIVFGGDPTWLYIGTPDVIVGLRAAVATGRLSSPETTEGGNFTDFAATKDGQYLIASGDPVVRLYSLRNGTPNRVSSLDDFLVETDVMTHGMAVTATRDGGEFYVYGHDTQVLPETNDYFVAILRIVADDQLSVVGQHDLGFADGVTVSGLALSADGAHLLVSSHDGSDFSNSLTSFPIEPNGFLGTAGADPLRSAAGDSLGPAGVLHATSGGDFFVTGWGGHPLSRVSSDGDGVLTTTPLLDRTVEPQAIAAYGGQVLIGNGTSLNLMAGLRRGGGLDDMPITLGGGVFGTAITDIAISADGSRVATLTTNPDGNTLQLYSRTADGELSFMGATTINALHAGLAFSPDGEYLYAGADLAWGIDTGNLVALEPMAPSTDLPAEHTTRVRISPDGLWLFQVINNDEPFYETRVFRRDTQTGLLTELGAGSAAPFENAVDVAFSPDSVYVYVLRAVPSVDAIGLRLDVYRWNEANQSHDLVAQHSEANLSQHQNVPIGELAMDPQGRFIFFVGRNQGQVAVYDRNPATGDVIFRENLALPAGSAGTHDGDISLAVGSSGELYVANERLGRVDVYRRNCVVGDSRNLCVGTDNRFLVEINWRTEDGFGYAHRVEGAPPSDSGLFYFFSENNWEALVKVLDGCAINNRFWVFAATTTNVEYDLKVTDTLTGEWVNYRQNEGEVIPAITDTDAFDTCGRGEVGTPSTTSSASTVPENATGPTVMHLGNFDVKLNWTTPAGLQGVGHVVPFQSEDSGVFTFFSDNNWETLVKVLDGCAINDHYWVFAAAPTDVGFTLEVKNMSTGVTKTWTNRPGQPAPSIIDTEAFACP